MTLFTRITRLFKADVHGILDSLEDPETILKQSIREMQQVIDHSQSHLQDLNKRCDLATAAQKKLTSNRDGFEHQLDLAFADDNELLIKALLRKKLIVENRLIAIAEEIRTLNQQISDQQSELDEQQEKIKTIVEKLSLFSNLSPQTAMDQSNDPFEKQYQNLITEDDIELAYLQEKQRRSQAPTPLKQPE